MYQHNTMSLGGRDMTNGRQSSQDTSSLFTMARGTFSVTQKCLSLEHFNP